MNTPPDDMYFNMPVYTRLYACLRFYRDRPFIITSLFKRLRIMGVTLWQILCELESALFVYHTRSDCWLAVVNGCVRRYSSVAIGELRAIGYLEECTASRRGYTALCVTMAGSRYLQRYVRGAPDAA